MFILRRYWISDISRIRSWSHSFKNTKVESYSEVTLCKMILVHTQYSLNRDHQHHKRRQQKSWISYPDCQDAQDKQQTQYLLTPRSKMVDAPKLLKFPNQNVQIFGYVYQNTSSLNHGPVWKTQLFLLKGICTVIL